MSNQIKKATRTRKAEDKPLAGPVDDVAIVREVLGSITAATPGYNELPDEAKTMADRAFELIAQRRVATMPIELKDDGLLEAKLPDGRLLTLKKAMGEEIVRADRDMSIFTEAGDRELMRPLYTLAACARIDGERTNITELQELLPGSDFLNLLRFFRGINLL